MPGSTLNRPRRALKWRRKAAAQRRMGRRRGRGRRKGRKTKQTKTAHYQRRRSQRRRGRFVISNELHFHVFCFTPDYKYSTWHIYSAVRLAEDAVSGARANSGGMASLCLDHRHGPPEMSLHTPDGRWGTRRPHLHHMSAHTKTQGHVLHGNKD